MSMSLSEFIKCEYFLVKGTLETTRWGNEISWAIMEGDKIACASQAVGTYGSHSLFTFECKLCPDVKYKIHCKDSYGDGWHGGYLQFKDMYGHYWGNQFCKNFTSGHKYSTEVTIPRSNGKK